MENNTSGKTLVSYSQLSTFNQCQYRWKLKYIDKLNISKDSIHLLFGTSMHTTLQTYLDYYYNKSVEEADALDLEKILLEEMKSEFTKSVEKYEDFPCTKEELSEFYLDGVEIIRFFKKKKSEYFAKKGFKLVGCEVPLEVNLTDNIQFVAYLDVVLLDTINNNVYIKDFKTSTKGWTDYLKKDESKTQQLVLYKKFYSEQFNIPIENIFVEFIILKRKLYENIQYPQKRIQSFSPASGKPSVNKVSNNLNNFLSECFNSDGTLKKDKQYIKNYGEKACRFCEFNGTPNCDAPIIQ